jgi:hypothetical protein
MHASTDVASPLADLIQGERGDSAGRALAPSNAGVASLMQPARRRFARRRPVASTDATARPLSALVLAYDAQRVPRIGPASGAGLHPMRRLGAGHVREGAFSEVSLGWRWLLRFVLHSDNGDSSLATRRPVTGARAAQRVGVWFSAAVVAAQLPRSLTACSDSEPGSAV